MSDETEVTKTYEFVRSMEGDYVLRETTETIALGSDGRRLRSRSTIDQVDVARFTLGGLADLAEELTLTLATAATFWHDKAISLIVDSSSDVL